MIFIFLKNDNKNCHFNLMHKHHVKKYDYNCINNYMYSGHCLNEFLCNKQTGQCDRGCNPVYSNNDRSKGVFHFLSLHFDYLLQVKY